MSVAMIVKIQSEIKKLRDSISEIQDKHLPEARVKLALRGDKKKNDVDNENEKLMVDATENSENRGKNNSEIVSGLEERVNKILAEISALEVLVYEMLAAQKALQDLQESNANKNDSSNAVGNDAAVGQNKNDDGNRRVRFDESPKASVEKVSEEESKKLGKSGGVRLSITNLQEKLKEVRLKKSQSEGNESEEVRGFTDGGASKDESKTLDAEVKMIEAMLTESRVKLLELEIADQQKFLTLGDVKNVQQAVRETIADAKERGMVSEDGAEKNSAESRSKTGHVLSFTSSTEAMGAAKKIAGLYESLGLPTSISESRSGEKQLITVMVEIPNELAGQDPLKLSAKEILEAVKGEKTLGSEKQNQQEAKPVDEESWVSRVDKGKTGLGLQTGKVGEGGWVDYVGARDKAGLSNKHR